MYDFLVIDAMNLAYRSWWPVRQLKTQDGINTGLEYGFLKNLLFLTREFIPANPVLAWDGRPTKGLELHSEYKANRDKKLHSEEAPWSPRLKRLRELLSPVLISLYHPEEEADEQIARFVRVHEKEGKNSLIVSNDQDLHQLVTDRVHINLPDSKKLDPEGIQEKWLVPSKKVVFVRAISGDTSDNIPGIPRIAATTKTRLAKKATSIDNLLSLIDIDNQLTPTERKKLREGKDIIRRNFTMMCLEGEDKPPTQIGTVTGDVEPVLEFCRELELKSLLERREWKLFSPE